MKLPWKDWLKSPTPIKPETYVGSDSARNQQTVRAQFVSKAKSFLRGVPLASEIVALYFCMLDPKTPAWVKAAAAAALAYFILPLDAVPDFLPLVGLSDDLSVLSAAIAALSSFITDDHRQQARLWLETEHVVNVHAEVHNPST